MSRVEFVREGYCEKDNVENDEAVACLLQGEFSRIDCLASGLSNGGPEHLQESVLAQNWLGPSGHDNDQQAVNEPGMQMENAVPCRIIIEEAGDHNRVENDVQPEIKMFASCYSPGGEKPSYVDDLLHIFDIADESSLDGEVGKRLNQMVPVPHVPKTIEKIPTVDEEISDHQRLLERPKEGAVFTHFAIRPLPVHSFRYDSAFKVARPLTLETPINLARVPHSQLLKKTILKQTKTQNPKKKKKFLASFAPTTYSSDYQTHADIKIFWA
ncbi:hypothetical protein CMV_025008 [Castanea mollissima]|uniref:Uncharacterized protein n=1 Tax=Castanea mollissima TaxID=60419 RepID=A0A8J4QE94_9ROSI|nr:hypothetical protein CMV_025008 [Castanea mollissima]